jgi:2-polyprenyl-3-methyl-5-hydroxy-6-metoxy-1,4-benzoquinol methylase
MRKKSWGEYNKSILDKVIEKVRYSVISNHIKGPVVLDLGCGFDAELLKSIENKIMNGVGIDISVNKNLSSKKIRLIQSKVDSGINLPSQSFDTIIVLALIEHVENPGKMLSESYRLLKDGGRILITTPSKYSKLILEFLAHSLHLISREEVSDHKRYYDKTSLTEELTGAGFKKGKIEIKYFEAGLNIFAKAIK